MLLITFVLLLTNGYSEAFTDRIPVEPVDGKCLLPDEDGTVLAPGDGFNLDHECSRLTCVEENEYSYVLEHEYCDPTPFPKSGQNCILEETSKGSYPDCCPKYQCHPRSQAKMVEKRQEDESDFDTEPADEALYDTSTYLFIKCMEEAWKNNPWMAEFDVDISEEITKLTYMGMNNQEEKLSEERSKEQSEEGFSEKRFHIGFAVFSFNVDMCSGFVHNFLKENVNLEDPTSFELSVSEKQELQEFTDCFKRKIEDSIFSSDTDSQTDPPEVKAQIMSLLSRRKRQATDDSPAETYKERFIIFVSVTTCFLEFSTSQSESVEIEPIDIQKREMSNELTESENTNLHVAAEYVFFKCMEQKWKLNQWNDEYDVNVSEEKMALLMRMKRQEAELTKEMSEEQAEEVSDINTMNFEVELWRFRLDFDECYDFYNEFLQEKLKLDEFEPVELSVSEKEELDGFAACLSKNFHHETESSDIDSQIEDPEATEEIISLFSRRKRQTESEQSRKPTLNELRKMLFAMNTCFEKSSTSEPESVEIEPRHIRKREVKNDLTSSEEETFEFFYCLTLHPEIVWILEHELANEIQKLESHPESRLLRIARKTSESREDVTEEEIAAMKALLECAGVELEEDNEETVPEAKRVQKRDETLEYNDESFESVELTSSQTRAVYFITCLMYNPDIVSAFESEETGEKSIIASILAKRQAADDGNDVELTHPESVVVQAVLSCRNNVMEDISGK